MFTKKQKHMTSASNRRKLIIDTDPGIDDTAAILTAFGCGEFEVIGLTTIFGNVDVATATQNALRLLQFLEITSVPVCQGAERGWIGSRLKNPVHVHGVNGLGNVELPVSSVEPSSTKAADFIVQQCNLFPCQVSLLILGPLTNLADALSLDPHLSTKWDSVVVLGGAYFVNGNVSPIAEANMIGDPEAADFVVQKAGNLHFVGLDITMKCPLTTTDLIDIGDANEIGKVLKEMYLYYLRSYTTRFPELNGAPPHDAVALMALVDPSLFEWVLGPIRVATNGMCRGQTILSTNAYEEENEWSGIPHNRVAMSTKAEIIIDRIKQYLMDSR
eukprot:g4002.t1